MNEKKNLTIKETFALAAQNQQTIILKLPKIFTKKY